VGEAGFLVRSDSGLQTCSVGRTQESGRARHSRDSARAGIEGCGAVGVVTGCSAVAETGLAQGLCCTAVIAACGR